MTFKENIGYLKYFGFKLTFWKTVNRIARKNGIFSRYAREQNTREIENYIKKICSNTYCEYLKNDDVKLDKIQEVEKNIIDHPELKNNAIWTMWWQGEENAPEIVRLCINSMRKYSNGHPVIVLDKDNYTKYIKLPDIIIKRNQEIENDRSCMKKNSVDNTKISDILRCALLSYYGGLWCDATIFFSDKIPECYFKDEWSTLGQDNEQYIGSGKWSGFFMGCQAGSPLLKYIYKMHIEYFEKKRYWVHYLLIDYFIDIAYKEKTKNTIMIDNVNCKNRKCLTFNRKHDDIANEIEIEQFLKKQTIHKLSWRWWGNDKNSRVPEKKDVNRKTWFEYLYENYMNDL